MKTTEKYKVGSYVNVMGLKAKVILSQDSAFGSCGLFCVDIPDRVVLSYVSGNGEIKTIDIAGSSRIDAMIDKE